MSGQASSLVALAVLRSGTLHRVSMALISHLDHIYMCEQYSKVLVEGYDGVGDAGDGPGRNMLEHNGGVITGHHQHDHTLTLGRRGTSRSLP